MAIYPVRPPPHIASGFKPAGRPNHFGLDLAGTAGDPVGAPEAGEVVEVWGVDTDGSRADNTSVVADKRFDGYGPAGVLIKGDSGVFHLLAHLDPGGWLAPTETSVSLPPTIAIPRPQVFVPAKGDKVLEGEQLGRMPTHVGASGPHVHWEVRKQPIDNPTTRELNTLDPAQWVAAKGDASKVAEVKSIATGKPGDIPFWVWLLVGYYLIRKTR